MHECLVAAEELQKEGISAEVIDLRSLVPLDYDRVFESVRKTGRVLITHAATEFCAFGAELVATIQEELHRHLKGPALRLGADYAPIAFSREIETSQIPSASSVSAHVRAAIKL